jgi:hemin uptake protein HemP
MDFLDQPLKIKTHKIFDIKYKHTTNRRQRMTQEILFRGIRTDGGGWVEGDLYRSKWQGRYWCGIRRCWGVDVYNHKVIPETVGQYIRTINAQRLFDGDMFIDINHPEDIHKIEITQGEPAVFRSIREQGVVDDWVRDRCSLNVFAAAWADTFKIIGTIHDHLLEAINHDTN